MPYAHPEALVSTEWLSQHLGADEVRIVDGTYMMPALRRDARAEFEDAHIPGAVFFDIDRIADTGSPLPHMLPSAERFATEVGKLGLDNASHVVVYDTHGMMSAARVWWMFRVFGHDRVSVLDGGLPKWKAEGRPLESGPANPPERHFTARPDISMVRELDQVRANIEARGEQLVDARAAGRFAGTDEEVWPGRRRGHVPGSLNLPYTDLIAPGTKTFLPAEALRARVKAAGIDMERPVVTSCGSGITACVVAFALHLLGKEDVAVYDGSWAEWGLRQDVPVATGQA